MEPKKKQTNVLYFYHYEWAKTSLFCLGKEELFYKEMRQKQSKQRQLFMLLKHQGRGILPRQSHDIIILSLKERSSLMLPTAASAQSV